MTSLLPALRTPVTSVLLLAATTVFQASSATLITLYSFKGSPDGNTPYAGVVIGNGVMLYGTTFAGGTGTCSGGCGTVFSLTPPTTPGGIWAEAVLYSFQGGTDGSFPTAGVVIGSGGVLYGTTSQGGTSNACYLGCGTVFSLTPPASPAGKWTESVLHDFTGDDGAKPSAGVVIGERGVLYGTTRIGGPGHLGTIFSLAPPAAPGGVWTESVLYDFARGSGGGTPYSAGVAFGGGGALVGATYQGGTFNSFCGNGCGTVFSLTPPNSGKSWTEAVLYSFTANSDGSGPLAGVVIGTGGVLYGTTIYGGAPSSLGTVFSLTPPTSSGGAWTEAVLHTFTGADGSNPRATVTIGAGETLYGTTQRGGTGSCYFTPGCGTVFSLTPPASPGGTWTHSVLYNFSAANADASDGFAPYGSVVIGNGGLLYGTTWEGGTAGGGTVFALQP